MKKIFRLLTLATVLLVANHGLRAQCSSNFTFTIGSGGVVTFTSTSINTTSTTMYYWSLGNNTFTSGLSQVNASATYTTNASYQVTLWLTDTLNSCSSFFTDTILVNTAGCNDNLTINHQQAPNGLVSFQASLGTYVPPSGSSWNFGDGGTSNSIGGASHTYSASGMYLVTLSHTVGICTYTASKSVSVTVASCSINASFTFSLNNNGVANFFSTTTGAGSNATYYWYFGDGGTATGQNATHAYNMNSNYHVILLVNDSTAMFGCQDSTMKQVNITNAPCFNNTSFTVAKDTNQLLTWNAMPVYPSNVSTAVWTWGDGSSSTGFYPSHTYSAAGFYSISLSTTLACGSPTTVIWMGNIFRPEAGSNGNGAMVTLNVLNPNTAVGIKNNVSAASHFKYYPSPVTDMITIEIPNSDKVSSVRILDGVGKVILSELLPASDNGKSTVDVSSLASGLYYLQIESNGHIENAKMIKQ